MAPRVREIVEMVPVPIEKIAPVIAGLTAGAIIWTKSQRAQRLRRIEKKLDRLLERG